MNECVPFIYLYTGIKQPIAECTPEFVGDIRCRAAHSSIKISWSAPNLTSGEDMYIEQYYVEYTFRSEYSVKETTETEFELSHLPPLTYVLFSVRAEYKGRLGPGVYIGQSTGKLL